MEMRPEWIDGTDLVDVVATIRYPMGTFLVVSVRKEVCEKTVRRLLTVRFVCVDPTGVTPVA